MTVSVYESEHSSAYRYLDADCGLKVLKGQESNYEWARDFPFVFGHTSVAFLKSRRGFHDAKNGSLEAARSVVSQCIKFSHIKKLRDAYPDACVLPVLTQNMLPLALAEYTGLPICDAVKCLQSDCRKNMCAMQRLLQKTQFFGKIQSGVKFILIDDIITQGGMMASLRRFILKNGGSVSAVSALAFSTGSNILAPTEKNLFEIYKKFGNQINGFLKAHGIADTFAELTNSQVLYLLRFSSMKSLASFMERHRLQSKAQSKAQS